MDDGNWDRRYRTGDYTPRTYPSALLADTIDWLPDGRALEIATGTGRNARFLADHGYAVDAVDISIEALRQARNATAADHEVNWIRADLEQFDVSPGSYDLVIGCFYHDLNLFPRLIDALSPGGILIYEHHVGPAAAVDRGPSSNRFRLRSNDLLRACLELTILEYRESKREYESGHRAGQTAAIASVLARKSGDDDAPLPPAR